MIAYVNDHLAPNSGDAVAGDHPLAAQTLDANVMGMASTHAIMILRTVFNSHAMCVQLVVADAASGIR